MGECGRLLEGSLEGRRTDASSAIVHSGFFFSNGRSIPLLKALLSPQALAALRCTLNRPTVQTSCDLTIFQLSSNSLLPCPFLRIPFLPSPPLSPAFLAALVVHPSCCIGFTSLDPPSESEAAFQSSQVLVYIRAGCCA